MSSSSDVVDSLEDEHLELFLGTGRCDNVNVEYHFQESGVEANEYNISGIFPLTHK
jgi:hypothetical protein